MIELLLALLVAVGVIDVPVPTNKNAGARESIRDEHRPTFAEVACFVECPQHCLWPEMPTP